MAALIRFKKSTLVVILAYSSGHWSDSTGYGCAGLVIHITYIPEASIRTCNFVDAHIDDYGARFDHLSSYKLRFTDC